MPRRQVPTVRKVGGRRYAQRRARAAAMGRSRIVRRAPPTVYSFKRQIFYENLILVNSGAPSGYAFQQAFSQLPNYTEFTNLYDQYMIKKIVVKMIPKITQHNLSVGTTTNSDLPQVHSALDYDDASTPTSVQQLCEYQSYKMTRGNQVHTRVLVPKIELNADSSVSAPKAYQWLDCDAPTLNHRGIKWWFSAPSSANTTVYYDMLVKVYFSCKTVL